MVRRMISKSFSKMNKIKMILYFKMEDWKKTLETILLPKTSPCGCSPNLSRMIWQGVVGKLHSSLTYDQSLLERVYKYKYVFL